MSIYTDNIKHGLRTAGRAAERASGKRAADCGVRTADCRIGIKDGLRYKTRAEKYGRN